MKTISISDLKARLSARIRDVRAGGSFLVMDRDHPVAELRPVDTHTGLKLRPPKRKKADFQNKLRITLTVDPVAYLIEDRRK